MSNKIERATEIHRSMTPHQMALRIVELEDIAEIVGQSASERGNRIDDLQDALDLSEEAVRAKHFPDAAKMVPAGWQLVPVALTDAMGDAIYKELGSPTDGWYGFDDAYQAMLAAAPKLGGE